MAELRKHMSKMLPQVFGEEYAEIMLEPTIFREYFEKAFTHRTFEEGDFNYEIMEKLGDKILNACIQQWLFDILYPEVTIPEPYAEMEKVLKGKDFLHIIMKGEGLIRFIMKREGFYMDDKALGDVLEGFIGALTLVGDRFISPGIGYILARQWIFLMYNKYARSKIIDGGGVADFKDYRSRVNEVWLFNGWGNQNYKELGSNEIRKASGISGIATVQLYAPNHPSVPRELQGTVIGIGTGKNLDEAGEEAAKKGLETLNIAYHQLKESEEFVNYENLPNARLGKVLKDRPKLYARLMRILKNKKYGYDYVQIKSANVIDTWVVQLRIYIAGNYYKGSRSRHSELNEAIYSAIEKFVKSVENGKMKLAGDSTNLI